MSGNKSTTGRILPTLLAGAKALFWEGPEVQSHGFDGKPKSVSNDTALAALSVVMGWFRSGTTAEDHQALAAELGKEEHPGYIVTAWEIILSPLAAGVVGWIITQLEANKDIEAENWNRVAAEMSSEAAREG
jgi:hypothetical protein